MMAAFAFEAIIVSVFALTGILAAGHLIWVWSQRKKDIKGGKNEKDLPKSRDSESHISPASNPITKKKKRRTSNAFDEIPNFRKETSLNQTIINLRSALRGTVAGFWEGAVMFSVSLSIAGTVAFFRNSGSYALFFSALVTVFSSSCAYVLWPLVDGITGRRNLYNVMLALISLQQILLFGAFRRYVDMDNYYTKVATTSDKHIRGELWEQHCFQLIKPIDFIEKIVYVTLVFGSVVLIKMFIVEVLRPSLRMLLNKFENFPGGQFIRTRFLEQPWIERNKIKMDIAWKIFVGVCGFSMMWGSYARIWVGKKRLLGLSSGNGNLEGENNWEFGQITALLTWAPYSLEFIFVLCCMYSASLRCFILYSKTRMDC